MKRAFVLMILIWGFAPRAHAAPYVIGGDGNYVFDVDVLTAGSFSCDATLSCVVATNAVTLTSATGSATLTFNGIDDVVHFGTSGSFVSTLGSIDVTSTPGFTFPTVPCQPPNCSTAVNTQPVLEFLLSVTNLDPSPATLVQTFRGFPGGGTSLNFQITAFPRATEDILRFPMSEQPPTTQYAGLLYSFPQTFTVPSSGSAEIIARTSAIPEPASMLLMGSGLLGVWGMRRRTPRHRVSP